MPLHAQEQTGTVAADALRRQAHDRLLTLQTEADRLARQASGLLGELRRLELARQIANEELRQADAALADATRDLDDITTEVAGLEQARDAEGPRLRARFAELYKLGRGRYMRMLLSARDMRVVSQAGRTVAAVAARDQARVRAYEARLVALTEAKAVVRTRQATLNSRHEGARRAQASAARAITAQNARVREIDQRRDLNAQLVGELQAAQQKLDATLTTVGTLAFTALPIGPFRGALPWPAVGTPQPRAAAAGAHRPGIEIAGAEGAAVQAVHDGTVAFAGSFDGLGNLVIIDHGEQTFTLYGHLLEFAVGRGTTVTARQEVGRLGASAVGTPSLYFELRVHGKAVDPMPWLERSR